MTLKLHICQQQFVVFNKRAYQAGLMCMFRQILTNDQMF